jgi:hypothetical protein
VIELSIEALLARERYNEVIPAETNPFITALLFISILLAEVRPI